MLTKNVLRVYFYVSLNLVAADSVWIMINFMTQLFWWSRGAILFYFRQPVPEQAAAGREVDVQDSGAGTVTDALHILQTTINDSL